VAGERTQKLSPEFLAQKWSRTPKSYAWYAGRGILAGVVLLASCLAIGGLTGLMRTEYKTTPGQQAILLVLGWSCYGIVPGALVGLLIGWLSRRRNPENQRSIPNPNAANGVMHHD
jgi:F420-0:gamma-glutamyl ligase-like protein